MRLPRGYREGICCNVLEPGALDKSQSFSRLCTEVDGLRREGALTVWGLLQEPIEYSVTHYSARLMVIRDGLQNALLKPAYDWWPP